MNELEPFMILRVPQCSVYIYAMPSGENTKKWVNQILANIMGMPAETSNFYLNEQGKPILPLGLGYANWSHGKNPETGAVECVLAYSEDYEVGIDLEFFRARDFFAFSKRFFAAEEATSNGEYFYRLWTRKEAFYKCCGGEFFSVLKTDFRPLPQTSAPLGASLWNFQGPYFAPHELALCVMPPRS